MTTIARFFIPIIAAALLAGCTSKTEFGPCVGAFDDKNPDLTYKVSTGNVIVAAIFSETIVVPVVVVLDETMCPIGAKKQPGVAP